MLIASHFPTRTPQSQNKKLLVTPKLSERRTGGLTLVKKALLDGNKKSGGQERISGGRTNRCDLTTSSLSDTPLKSEGQAKD